MNPRGRDDRRRRRDDGDPADAVLVDDVRLRSLPEEAAHRASFDPARLSPSLLVPLAVAAVRGVSVDALPQLYDSVAPAALDRLCGDRDTTVSFTYAGCRLTVEGSGELLVRDAVE